VAVEFACRMSADPSLEGSDACPNHVVWSRLDGNDLKKVSAILREHMSEIVFMEPDSSGSDSSEDEAACADNYADLIDLGGAHFLGDTSSNRTISNYILPATRDKANAHMLHSIQSETLSAAGERERVRKMPSNDPMLKRDDQQTNAKEKTGKVRPCKGQRRRHHKFMEQMKMVIDDDPEGFDLASARLPPSLEPGSGFKSTVLAKLEAYKLRVMRQRQIRPIIVPPQPSPSPLSSTPF